MNQPATRLCWVKRSSDRHERDASGFEVAGDMRESYPEDCSDLANSESEVYGSRKEVNPTT